MVKIFMVTSLEIISLLCNVYRAPTQCKTQSHMLGSRLRIVGLILSMVYVDDWAPWGGGRLRQSLRWPEKASYMDRDCVWRG